MNAVRIRLMALGGVTVFALAACATPQAPVSPQATPNVPATLPAAITIPPCEDGDCPLGFELGGRLYFLPCSQVRADAVDQSPHVDGAGPFRGVRRIAGLPPELFLAVRGSVNCGGGVSDSPWWLAQTAEAVSALTPPLRDSLSEAMER